MLLRQCWRRGAHCFGGPLELWRECWCQGRSVDDFENHVKLTNFDLVAVAELVGLVGLQRETVEISPVRAANITNKQPIFSSEDQGVATGYACVSPSVRA